MRNRHAVVALLAALAVLSAAQPAAAGAPPVRIGVSISGSGPNALLARYLRRGYELWVEDVNRRGGLLGRPVELVVRDDRGDPAAARSAYEGFCERGEADLVFAPFSSDLTGAVVPAAARCGFPVIAAGASADRLWQQGHHTLFGIFLPASRLTMSFLELLTMRGVERVAVVHDGSSFASEVAEGTVLWAGRLGLEVVAELRFDPRAPDPFPPLLEQARRSGAEAVILAGYLAQAIDFAGAVARGGWRPRATYVTVGLGAPEFVERLGPAADLVFSTSQWEYDAPGPPAGAREFHDRYVAAYGAEPSYFAATAFAAGQILEAAAARTGTLEPARLAAEIATLDAESIIGRFGVDREGMQIKKFDLVVQLQGGRREVVWPRELATAEAQLR